MVCLRVRSARMVRRGMAARSGNAVKRARRVNRMASRISIGAGVDLDGGSAGTGGVGVVLGEEPLVEFGEGSDARDERLEEVEAVPFLDAANGEGVGVEVDV